MQVATHQHARIYGENISISAGGFCVITFSPCCWDTHCACSFEPVEGARALEVYCMDDICVVLWCFMAPWGSSCASHQVHTTWMQCNRQTTHGKTLSVFFLNREGWIVQGQFSRNLRKTLLQHKFEAHACSKQQSWTSCHTTDTAFLTNWVSFLNSLNSGVWSRFGVSGCARCAMHPMPPCLVSFSVPPQMARVQQYEKAIRLWRWSLMMNDCK